MKHEAQRNLEREVSARFGLPAPTILYQSGQAPGLAISRLTCATSGHGSSAPAEPEDAYVLHVMLRDVDRYELRFKGERAMQTSARRDATFFGALRNQPMARLDTPFDMLRIYVSQAALDDHVGTLGGPSRTVLQPKDQGILDTVLAQMARSLLPVFDQVFDRGQLFVDSISLAILDHLVRAFGGRVEEKRAEAGGLAPWLERRAKEFIESRISEGTSLEAIARHCELSPSHFSKAFRSSTGRPPHRWLLERRIERSKTLLKDDELSLSEVAKRCGFSDASHFSRTFSQQTREPPAAWRRRNRG